jgi:hypothetical protein
MKIVGTGLYDANVTTTTNSLMAAMLIRPEISVNVANLFEQNKATFTSFLARKGMVKKGAVPGLTTQNFRVVGNRKFMWSLKGYPFRKGVIKGYTLPSGMDANKPGEDYREFTLQLDTNYFSPNDVLELKDTRTQLIVLGEYPEEVGGNVFNYTVKLIGNVAGGFINPDLLTDGSEIGFAYTAFPELSETGYEKNTFPEWLTSHMTIQRMQFSISGSANNTVLWVEHNGQKLWLPQQKLAMLERMNWAREQQLVFGQSTIDANDKVFLKDLKGRDIIIGDGIVEQGDPALKFQYNNLNMKFIEKIMQNMQLLANSDGKLELFVGGGQQFYWEFSRLMRDVFKYNPIPLFVNESDQRRGVNATFNMYEMAGVAIYTAWVPAFDAAWRPRWQTSTSNNINSKRAFFASLGNTIGGDPGVELVALGNGSEDRTYVEKIIEGMTSVGSEKGRIYASNSMDGGQVQVLSETGVKMSNPYGFAEVFGASA